MMPRKFISFALLTLVSAFSIIHAHAQANESLQKDALNRENQLWQSFLGEHFNAPMFSSWLAPDYLGIESSGKIVTKDETIQMLSPCTFFSYQITNPQVRFLSRTSYVFIYQVTFEDSCHGGPRHIGSGVNTEAWEQRHKKWTLAIHDESIFKRQ